MSLFNVKWLADHFEQEIPSGTVNGVNKVYTLTESPHNIKSVFVFMNSQLQYQVSDYTVTNEGSITFVDAPNLGQEIYVIYMKKES